MNFLANKNAELAIVPSFWPVNCIKIRFHFAKLSVPTVYLPYCAKGILLNVDWHCGLPRANESIFPLAAPM